MEALVAIPAILAAIVAFRRGPQAAFLDVYLPVLLLLPDYYRWPLPGLPDPTFNQAAILPVAVLALVRYGRLWRWSVTDFLVLGMASSIACSEYVNAGYAEAQNLMFDMAASFVLPYFCAKLLVEPLGLRFACARRIVWLLFLISVISVYEFRFGATPFRLLLDRFFPWQGDAWVTTFRWGLARIAGPYGHAILAGAILTIGYRLQRWLEWSGGWEPRFRGIGLPKARTLTLVVLGGIAMTLVRGPWIGAIAGAAVTAIGLTANPRRAARALFALALLVGVPAGYAVYSWASVGRANAKSDSQETAAYRKELIDQYVDIALDHAALGWGRNTWPRVAGMPSIDNHYLLLALMHGVIALALLVAIFLWMGARLFYHAMSVPPGLLPRGGSLSLTFLGILVAVAVTIATVFMGTQLPPLFAVIVGWAEGLLLYTGDAAGSADEAAAEPAPQVEFARVAL